MIRHHPLLFGGAVLTIVVATAELTARTLLGLGRPPLYIADRLTEYRLQPSQKLRRFGNRIDVNQFSMRSGPFERRRQGQQRRVLVVGDSVVWGGSQLDQRLIATELLAHSGIAEVGNVAAPSWGPGNWLGYAKRFGFLDSTDVVLVISSHDAVDNPNPEPFRGDINHPLQSPPSAFFEGVQRYLLPRLGLRFDPSASPTTNAVTDSHAAEPTSAADPRVQQALSDLRRFLSLARASGAHVAAVQFADREEARNGQLQLGNQWIAQVLKQEGIPSIQAGPIFRSCGPIDRLYTDGIHPYTAAGQSCLAKAIKQALTLRTKQSPGSGHS